MKNWKAVVVTFGIFFNVFMYEALSLESNTLFEALSESFVITVPYYFSNSINFSTISNSMIQGLTNFSQLIDSTTTNLGSSCPMTNNDIGIYLSPNYFIDMTNKMDECRWECDSEYIIKMLKRDGKLSEHIKKLIKDGEVCEVLGHKWEYGCSKGPGCLVYHSEQIRHCSLCLKEERQSVIWK